jgi:hypothetical protein
LIYYIDIDNTICDTKGTDYAGAVPRFDIIEKVNIMYNRGHKIVFWTSRGVGSGIDYTDLTIQQLAKWGVKYHELKLDKPVYDFFIDDKACCSFNHLGKNNANTL